MTDEPQNESPAEHEPVTEDRLAVTEVRPAVTDEPATAQHTLSSEPVELPTEISEPSAEPTPTPAAAPTPVATRPPIPPPVPPAIDAGPQPSSSPVDKVTTLVAERPEVGVGGAFAGGIVFALILKRLGR